MTLYSLRLFLLQLFGRRQYFSADADYLQTFPPYLDY